MSSQTVTTEGGRVSINGLPSLNTPQPGDTVLGLQNGKAGLFPLSSLGGGQTPDLSGYATTTALSDEAQARQNADDGLSKRIDFLSSTSVTGGQLDAAITAAINGLHIPSTDGLAKQSDLTAEVTARQQADTALGQRIDGLGQRIDALPSGGGSGSAGSATIASLPTWHGTNKAPVRLFGIIQDDGGAYNNSTIPYPGAITFKYPPIITGKTYVISFDEWGNGTVTQAADLVVKSVSNSSFTFQHVGPWPGNGQEWIVYSVEGVPV